MNKEQRKRNIKQGGNIVIALFVLLSIALFVTISSDLHHFFPSYRCNNRLFRNCCCYLLLFRRIRKD
jgi:hypothetical protein